MSNGEGFSDPTADQAIHNVTKKPWSDVTEQEITQIKKEKCRYCKYSNKNATSGESLINLTCDYIGREKHRRGCRPDECDKFVRTKTVRKRKAMKVKKESKTGG